MFQTFQGITTYNFNANTLLIQKKIHVPGNHTDRSINQSSKEVERKLLKVIHLHNPLKMQIDSQNSEAFSRDK